MSDKKDTKVSTISEFLQVKLDELENELHLNREVREHLCYELDAVDENNRNLVNVIEFLTSELDQLQSKDVELCDCDGSCACGSHRTYEDFLGDYGCKDYPEIDSYKYYAETCSGKCSDCTCKDQDDDSEIMTVSDLANTIDLEDKSPEQVMNELVIFTDEQVEEAIRLAIWDYQTYNISDEVFSKFTIRAFIKYLENNLSQDNGVEVDVGVDLAKEILMSNKGVRKISEGLYGRFQ